MIQSDARQCDMRNCLNADVILNIEKELLESPYDMFSLVFLLYDVPHTALQQLTVYQQSLYTESSQNGYSNMNLIHEWWQYAKSKPTWQNEFLEALLICQLYSVVRKLGLDVPKLKELYQPDSIDAYMYINPLKKALYKLCENINSENLLKLKKTLITFNIDTTHYESCEQVFLKLMCENFITVKQYQYEPKMLGYQFDMEKLLKIIKCLPGLQKFSSELKELQSLGNLDARGTIKGNAPETTTITHDTLVHESNKDVNFNNECKDLFEAINKLSLEDESPTEGTFKHYKTDTRTENRSEAYEIKNPMKVGVCIIINQEKFHPSKQSIDDGDELTDRLGSTLDMERLKNTMKSINFDVHAKSNLNSEEIFEFIKSVVENHVNSDTSIVMLCILSHGVRGHIYAADSVKVKVSNIQNYLDSNELQQVRYIPKVFIIQACQVDDTPHFVPSTFVPDGPKSRFYLAKSDFLVYWATAAEYEAYRSEKKGSIFIYCLCKTINQFSYREPVTDIFTEVTNRVTGLCTALELTQVPIFETTLKKKLYLQMPQ